MALTIIVTNAGRAALVNAANTGTAPVTIAQVGLSSTAVAPAKTATSLPGEFKRIATLSGDVVADDIIHLIVRDESATTYVVRSFGLYLADGTLFAIYGQAASIIEKASAAMLLLAIDVQFADVAASQLTFGNANFLNPPATTEQIGVVELATLAETIAGTDTARTPAAKMVKDAVFAWLDARFGVSNSAVWNPANDGAGSGLDADLLDGQQGSYYTDIVSRLGYRPINPFPSNGAPDQWYRNGNFRFTSTRNTGPRDGQYGAGLIVSSDGAPGSGATMTFHRFGSYAVNMGLDNDNVFRIGGGSINASAFALTDTGALSLNGSKAWTAGNDGAGSGLDADLLDGRQLGVSGDSVPSLAGNNEWAGQQTLTSALRVVIPGTRGGAVGGIEFYNSAASNGWFAGVRGFSPDDASGFNFVGLRFFTTSISAGERMRLTADGKLAIGTTTPTAMLHVEGDAVVATNLKIAGAMAWHAGNDGAGSGLDADLLDGRDWEGGQDVVFGRIDAKTPSNDGSTGGVRIHADPLTGRAILQMTNPEGTVEWGFAETTADKGFNWIGAGGLRAGGATAWKGNGFNGALSIDGNLTICNGADLVIESQDPGKPPSLIYNDFGTLGLRSSDAERIYVDGAGVVHVKGSRVFGNQATIPGSGNLRVFAAAPGGYAVETYDFQNYWPLQVCRDVNGTVQHVGGISCTDFTTTFVTSSDYRLKEDLTPLENPLERLNAIKVWNFQWVGTDRRTDGFVAHELAELIPEAVTGDFDGMREIDIEVEPARPATYDDDGIQLTAASAAVTLKQLVPSYQGVDQSKVVPLLVAAVQALAAQVDELKQVLAAA